MSTYSSVSDNDFFSSLNGKDVTVRCFSHSISIHGVLVDEADPGFITFTVGPSSNSRYKSLSISGLVFEGQKLQRLASDLFNTSFVVNRQGYCFHIPGKQISLLGSSWVVASRMALRLNDLFPWSEYGVPTSASPTEWPRCEMKDRLIVVDYKKLFESKKSELERCTSQQSSIRTELNKYKKMSEEKDKILEGYNKKLQERDQLNKELQNSKEEKEKLLEDSEKQLLEKDQLNKELQNFKEEKEKLLEDYEKQLLEKDQLVKDLQDSKGELSNCKNTLSENDAELKQSGHRLEKIKALKALVNSLVNSVETLSAVLQYALSNQDPVHLKYPADIYSQTDQP